ncbi:MAG: DUF3168 domain-containing protein [Roseovarius sp.]|nr:DUF3168 domain-containing protein [Roseovarius sp.]
MSYGIAAALQRAVYERLRQDTALGALVGPAIFDAPPPGPLPPIYVALGPEEVRARGDGSGRGAWHGFTVSVVSGASGFLAAKDAAGAVSDALAGAPLNLARGRLVALHFDRARARHEGGGLRRIDLRFRARVEETS